MKKKFLAIFMATLMSATILAGIAAVTAEDENKELLYYEFDIPTDILPEGASEISGGKLREDPYVDLECYDAWLSQPGADLKVAYFKIYNSGNIWAEAPWYTDILMDGSEEAYKTHIVDLKYGNSRSTSKAFFYEPNGNHTFQCWTDSGDKFTNEDSEVDNYDPRPPETIWIT